MRCAVFQVERPLIYLEKAEKMTCSICGRTEASNCRCVDGHYVCSQCHIAGIDSFLGTCLNESSTAPIEILHKLMQLPACYMHGPEYHILVGASILTAFSNAGGKWKSRRQSVADGSVRIINVLGKDVRFTFDLRGIKPFFYDLFLTNDPA